MVTPPHVLAQRILDSRLLGSGRQFLLPDETGFLVSDGMGASAASVHIRRLDPATLRETAKVRTADVPHDITAGDAGRLIACCTWRRVFVLDSQSLSILAQVSLGEGLGCLDMDAAEDHLVVGGMHTVNLLGKSALDNRVRKRIANVDAVARTADPHLVALLVGTEGRIAWFDCLTAKVVHSLDVGNFAGAIGDGAHLYLARGEPFKYYPQATGLGGIKVEIPPVDMVEPVAGLAVVDLARRAVVAEYATPTFGEKRWPLQLSGSRERVFVFGKATGCQIIRSVNLAHKEVEFDWALPSTALPLAVLQEGRRAIIADERTDLQRILLIARD